jgi:hypothetical protein
VNDDLERKVRTAGVAGWWTVLVGAVVLTIQWLAYLVVMSRRPAWILPLWASSDWTEIQHVWLVATVALKGVLAFLAMWCLWLTLWARELRKAARA